MGDVGAFFGGTALPFPMRIHSLSSTCPPERQMASSASKLRICFWYDVLANWAFWRRPLSSRGDNSALTRAEFLMDLARMPNRRVDNVSASL